MMKVYVHISTKVLLMMGIVIYMYTTVSKE